MTSTPGSIISPESVPRVVGGGTSAAKGLTPADWFVLSRVDGSTPVRVLRQLVGLSESEFGAAIRRLVDAGLLAVPGLSAPRPQQAAPKPASSPTPPQDSFGTAASRSSGPTATAAPATEKPAARRASDTSGSYSFATSQGGEPTPERGPSARSGHVSGSHQAVGVARPSEAEPVVLGVSIVPEGWPVSFSRFCGGVAESALVSGDALSREQKLVLLYFEASLKKITYYQLLGIQGDADPGAVRAAYFRMSKAFHPDRWFRKEIGEFDRVLIGVFKWLNRAYMVLSAPRKRKGYDRLLQQGYIGEWQLEEADDSRRTAKRAAEASAASEAARAQAAAAPAAGPEREQSARPLANGPIEGRAAAAASFAPPSTPETRSADSGRAVGVLLMRARKASADGDWASAADAYLRAVQLQGTSELRILAVECMLKANSDPSEIEREVRAATTDAIDDMRLLILEAEVARRLGQVDRAARCYSSVLAREPANPVARLGLERLGVTPD